MIKKELLQAMKDFNSKAMESADIIALKERLRLEREVGEENCKTAEILSSRIHAALYFIKKERFNFCNNNKCCQDGLNWLADEIEKRLLGR